MDDQKLLSAIESIFDRKFADNMPIIDSKIESMGTNLRSEMQAMADSSAQRAFGVYEERLISLLKVKDERLPDLILTSNYHQKRIEKVEQTVSIHGTAIKKISAKVFA